MDSVTVRYQYGNLLRFSVSWCSRNKVTLVYNNRRNSGNYFKVEMNLKKREKHFLFIRD